jgi:ribosomal protein L18E
MPARTTALLGAALAAAFATALPAPAADRLGDAGDDGPGAVLAGLLAQNSGGIFEANDDDRRTEQAARLCLKHAEDKVRDNGGDSADFDRLVDAETDGDRVRLLADMSADYDGDRRSARVACEVDFEGDNEVVAFRQHGEAAGVLGGILGRDDDLEDDLGGDGRREQAARLCLDHAEDEIRDNGGDDVRIDRVVDAERDGDKVRLLADMSADYDDGRRSAQVECEVDFDGDNEVVVFRQLGEAGGSAFDDLLRDLLGQQ